MSDYDSSVSTHDVFKSARKAKRVYYQKKMETELKNVYKSEQSYSDEISNQELEKNFPYILNLMAFYPEHTLVGISQKIIMKVKDSLILLSISLFLNIFVQVFHLFDDYYLPITLSILYCLVFVPLFYVLVFRNLYHSLQFGAADGFFAVSIFFSFLFVLFLSLPPKTGAPSIQEALLLYKKASGVLFFLLIGIDILIVLSFVFLVMAAITTYKNYSRLASIESDNIEE